MNPAIVDAINARQLLAFTYQGHQRRVIPVDYGVNHNGDESLQGYQVDGGSKRGGLPYWRQFKVAQIDGLVVLGETFDAPPEGYHGSSLFSTTYAVLSGSGRTSPGAAPAGGATAGGAPAGGQAGESGQGGPAVAGVPIDQVKDMISEHGSKIAGEAVKALGKWFRKR